MGGATTMGGGAITTGEELLLWVGLLQGEAMNIEEGLLQQGRGYEYGGGAIAPGGLVTTGEGLSYQEGVNSV